MRMKYEATHRWHISLTWPVFCFLQICFTWYAKSTSMFIIINIAVCVIMSSMNQIAELTQLIVNWWLNDIHKRIMCICNAQYWQMTYWTMTTKIVECIFLFSVYSDRLVWFFFFPLSFSHLLVQRRNDSFQFNIIILQLMQSMNILLNFVGWLQSINIPNTNFLSLQPPERHAHAHQTWPERHHVAKEGNDAKTPL